MNILNRRVKAFIIDLLVISSVRSIFIFIYLNKIRSFLFLDILKDIHLLTSFLTIIIFSGYFICSYYLSNGKTLGKLIFKLRVKSQQNSELKVSECFIRSFGYLFCLLNFFFLFLIPFITRNQKGIPDYISNTYIKLDEIVETEDFDINSI